jgi:malate dehydrogenase (oxaloacetate-decarboxylating)
MIEMTLTGQRLLTDPMLNAGTAFREQERSQLGLDGLLPATVETLEQQVGRAYAAYQRKCDDLERHIYLRALQDTNEVLFYRLLLDHIEEMVPMIYTPVVAQGCRQFSHIYRRPRGLFVSYPLRNSIPKILRNRPQPDVDVMVVTDGERVLGTGDQGVGGLGVSIGKLSLYTLIGGIPPSRTLPIVLDVGTNNPDHLRDPEYLGWRHPRVAEQEYVDFIDQFVTGVKQELPHTCVQWEDFATAHARPILDRYRNELLTFNDDIQGTAAVVLAAILAGVQVAGTALTRQHIVMLGAGSASIGVADYLRHALVAAGMTEQEARNRFWIVNRGGLLHEGRTNLTAEQRVYAQPVAAFEDWPEPSNGSPGLADVIRHVDATILIGLSTAAGAFTEPIVREMARKVERPLIFPLSNPTDRSEAEPADLIRWTDGRALVATGSPFSPVKHGGATVPITLCNNVCIFPAMGLGLRASGAGLVTDAMMVAAAQALAKQSPALTNPAAPLLPAVNDLRRAAVDIAVAVGLEAQRAGLARRTSSDELRARVAASQWAPVYPRLGPQSA